MFKRGFYMLDRSTDDTIGSTIYIKHDSISSVEFDKNDFTTRLKILLDNGRFYEFYDDDKRINEFLTVWDKYLNSSGF